MKPWKHVPSCTSALWCKTSVPRQARTGAGAGRSALPRHAAPGTPGGDDGRGHEGGGPGPGLHLRLREDRPARHRTEPPPDPGERPGRVGRRHRGVPEEAPQAGRLTTTMPEKVAHDCAKQAGQTATVGGGWHPATARKAGTIVLVNSWW